MYLLRKLNLNLLFICLTSFLFFLYSCTSEDGEELSGIENVSRELLIGSWKNLEYPSLDVWWTFNEDGTGYTPPFYALQEGEQSFSWRLDGNILTLYGTEVYQIIEIDNKNMLVQEANGLRTNHVRVE